MAGNGDRILHLKKKLEREVDKNKILATLNELNKLTITVDLLQKTGIGKTVRTLRKKTGEIGKISNSLYTKWKQTVTQPPCDVNKTSSSKDSKNIDKTNVSRTLTVEREDSYTVYDSDEIESMSKHKKKTLVNDDRDFNLIDSKLKRTKTENNDVKKSSANGVEIANSGDHKKHNVPVDTKEKLEDGKKRSREKSEKNSSSQSNSSKEKRKSKKRRLSKSGEEGFNATMVSFEDCLGLGDYKKSDKKKPNLPVIIPQKSTKTNVSKTSVKSESTNVSKTSVKSESTNSSSTTEKKLSLPENGVMEFPSPKQLSSVDILSTLPSIQPNYKPMRFNVLDSPPRKRKSSLGDIDTSVFMSSKHNRTQVFSGRKAYFTGEVPSLYETCIRVLQENIDALEYTGGVPYDQLKPVLLRCTPQQLYQIEDFNPYLLEDSDELWMAHCRQDFKKQEPGEFETWREFYLRKYDEREAKLKSITANISASMAKAVPVRQTKLAYVDSVAKPPRSIARRQAKFGTGLAAEIEQKSGSPVVKISHRHVANSHDSHSSEPGTSGSKAPVKKVAPLMQKTLKFMKNRFRR